MAHVVESPAPPFLSRSGALRVHQVPAAEDNLVWIGVCERTGVAFAVDGPDARNALRYCQDAGLTLSAVLNTHTHGDHIGINRDLQRRGLLQKMRVFGARSRAEDVPGLTDAVDEGDRIEFGALQIEVWRTEGHIDGHLSFLVDGVLFCGDTLFAGGCGYLFDGPPEKMYASLARLRQLPPDTRVCCAHEYTQDNLRFAWSVQPHNAALSARIARVWALRAKGGCAVPSTIAEETATNPFLRFDDPDLRAQVAAAMPDAPLATDAQVFAATRALKDRKDYRSRGDAGLPI